ncbi:MAG: MBL fold metallo-hydrolase [Halobacteriales archaeon]|nr:MBL fold metallo-hydrolase [Halobacteriales archaeon]
MPRTFPELGVEAPEITAEELKRRLDSGERVTVLDTRRPEEFEAWRIEHPNVENVNVPFTEFLEGDGSKPDEQVPVREIPDGVPDGEVVTSCAVGVSSKYVADLLRREGRPALGLKDGMAGWARLYESREVETADSARLLQYHRPSSRCLSYMVVSEDEAVVVDPLRAFVERYESDARETGARVVAVADTHVHADHISGVRELGDLTGADVVVPEGAEDRGLAYEFEYTTVGDGDRISFGGTALEAVALPGHTTEMTGYGLENADILLTGDTVFLRSVARPDLEKGDEGVVEASRQLFDTLKRLRSMPEETLVAPGHVSGEDIVEDGVFTSTVGELLDTVPLFGVRDKEEFVESMSEGLPPRPANYRRIISVNLGLSEADSEEAFELELGPNNCAVS